MSTAKSAKHYVSRDFWRWHNELVKENFLEIHHSSKNADIYSLKTPLTITLSSIVVLRLKRRYKPNQEIGGILLAEPTKVGSERTLLIKHVCFIRNISKSPKAYLPKGNRIQHMHKCLMGTKKGIRYFPLWFHSHTRNSRSLPEILHAYLVMSTSNADKKRATEKITYSRTSIRYATFAFPSALVIVTNEDEVFVGIYGGHLAPEDFQSYMEKLLEKSVKEMVEWGLAGESILRNIAGILGGIGVGFVGVAAKVRPEFRALSTHIALVKKGMDADLNYFGLSRDQDMRITIPEFQHTAWKTSSRR